MKIFKTNNNMLIKIETDNDVFDWLNPRDLDSNISHIALDHPDYDLGDKDLDPRDALNEMAIHAIEMCLDDNPVITFDNLKQIMLPETLEKFKELDTDSSKNDAIKSHEAIEDGFVDQLAYYDLYPYEMAYILRDEAVVVPVGMYEHSGYYIYLNHNDVLCNEDNGMKERSFDTSSIGYIFVTKEGLEGANLCTPDDTGNWKNIAWNIIASEFKDYANYVSSNNSPYRVSTYSLSDGSEMEIMNVMALDEEEALGLFCNNEDETIKAVDITETIDDFDAYLDNLNAMNQIKNAANLDDRIKAHNEMLKKELSKTNIPSDLQEIMTKFMDDYLKSDQRMTQAPIWMMQRNDIKYATIHDEECDTLLFINYDGEYSEYVEDEKDSLIDFALDVLSDLNSDVYYEDHCEALRELWDDKDWCDVLDAIELRLSVVDGLNAKQCDYTREWTFTGECYLTEAATKAARGEDTKHFRSYVSSMWKDDSARKLANYKYEQIEKTHEQK